LNAAELAAYAPGRREPFRNGDASALLQQYLALNQPSRRAPAPSGMMGAQPPNNLSIEAILGGIHNVGPSSSQPDAMTLLRELEQARSRGVGPSFSQPSPTMALLRELQARSRVGGIQNVSAGPSSSQPDTAALLRELEHARSRGGGIQNATAGPSSSQPDPAALLRELEQARSRGDLGPFRSLLQRGMFDGESGIPAPSANSLSSLLGQHGTGQAPSLPADMGALLQKIANQHHRGMRRDDRNR
jgi:hypothetical protein